MNNLILAFGLMLSLPAYYLLYSYWVAYVPRIGEYLMYVNPTMAAIIGVPIVSPLIFVAVCIGVGLLAAELFFFFAREVMYSTAYLRKIFLLRIASYVDGIFRKRFKRHD